MTTINQAEAGQTWHSTTRIQQSANQTERMTMRAPVDVCSAGRLLGCLTAAQLGHCKLPARCELSKHYRAAKRNRKKNQKYITKRNERQLRIWRSCPLNGDAGEREGKVNILRTTMFIFMSAKEGNGWKANENLPQINICDKLAEEMEYVRNKLKYKKAAEKYKTKLKTKIITRVCSQQP